MATRKLAFQNLQAENDHNGNPRRLWAVYDLNDDGAIVGMYDEGYSGRGVLHDYTTVAERVRAIELPSWDITLQEYREKTLRVWGQR